VRFVIEMIREGWNLIPYDPHLRGETIRTLRLAFESTGLALLVGTVPAYLIGVRASRPARWGLTIANAALGVPAVGTGVLLFLILPGRTPWGELWYGMPGMVFGQTILALPIIVALGAAAIRGLPDGLIDQARAFGASGWRLGAFAFREAKIGVMTAIILALGSAIAEVGAVTILGGNAEAATTTLSSEILNDVDNGGFGGDVGAVEHAIVVLGLMLALTVLLTVIQQWGAIGRRGRVRPDVRRALNSPR
jgi:tungstate transport system permease protein